MNHVQLRQFQLRWSEAGGGVNQKKTEKETDKMECYDDLRGRFPAR